MLELGLIGWRSYTCSCGRRADDEVHRPMEEGWRRTDWIRRARVLRGVFCVGTGKRTPIPKISAARRQAL